MNKEKIPSTKHFIIIDGSYFIFHRYHSIKSWYKHAINNKVIPEEESKEIDKETNKVGLSKEFIDKYIKTFHAKINELSKKLKINKNDEVIKIVGLDCPRKKIWRKKLYPDYKECRNESDDNVKDIFKLTYNNSLFNSSGISYSLRHDLLEADDVIAITTTYIQKKYPDANVWIITSDMDYLQLSVPGRVMLYDLSYKDLTKKKNSSNDKKKDLFCKIVMGDKSDNIPPIFNKCGFKTAEKLYNDNEELMRRLNNDDKILNQYNLNKELIDFNYIPEKYKDEFIKHCLEGKL
tara:strand:- start:49 stop:924 length:876 start_codon:yes stop_codon:yes gene_type:complete